MRWMSWKGRALAGGVLLAMAAAPGLAMPQSPTQAPSPMPKAAAPATAYTQETAPRISPEEARQALAKGQAVLVDVRSKEAYEASHAKGALSIPSFALESRLGELPKNKLIITYCT